MNFSNHFQKALKKIGDTEKEHDMFLEIVSIIASLAGAAVMGPLARVAMKPLARAAIKAITYV